MIPMDRALLRLTEAGPCFDVFDVLSKKYQGMLSEAIHEIRYSRHDVQKELLCEDSDLEHAAERIGQWSRKDKRSPMSGYPLQDELTKTVEISDLFAVQTSTVLREKE